MHINKKIDLLIRASRLYCHSMYQTYDPKYYPTISSIVLKFTNKLFGTKPVENKIVVEIDPIFDEVPKTGGYMSEYSGVGILVSFPDTSALFFELYKAPLIPVGDRSYTPRPIAS